MACYHGFAYVGLICSSPSWQVSQWRWSHAIVGCISADALFTSLLLHACKTMIRVIAATDLFNSACTLHIWLQVIIFAKALKQYPNFCFMIRQTGRRDPASSAVPLRGTCWWVRHRLYTGASSALPLHGTCRRWFERWHNTHIYSHFLTILTKICIHMLRFIALFYFVLWIDNRQMLQ